MDGITFIPIGGKAYLAANFTDETKRLLLYDGKLVRGTIYPEDEAFATIPITASPGIYEEQPANVPLQFNDVTAEIPAGYETANIEAVYTSYDYDPDEALANWECNLVVGNVVIFPGVINGDSQIEVYNF